jgi:hypothetical protein
LDPLRVLEEVGVGRLRGSIWPTRTWCTQLPAAYAHALRGELEKVLAAIPGARNNTVDNAAYALGQLAGAGLLDNAQVTAALTVAATHIELSLTEASRAIASGLSRGASDPRRTA